MKNNHFINATLPRALKKGGTIGVFAPSSWVNKEDIELSRKHIEKLGYNTFVHPQTYERENQSAGNLLQKALAFQGLWQRKDIDALWVAGGGNRCLHLLSTLNLNSLTESPPKPVIGFSDATALINAIYAHTKIITFHGPVYKNLHKYNPEQMEHLLALLGGEENTTYPLQKENILNEGKASGTIIGGNLSLFQCLPQILPDNLYSGKGAIIFLEECNEEISRIDRALMHLRHMDIFKKASAIIIGEFSELKDTGRAYGYTIENIISEHTKDLNVPVLYNMPFGHGDNLFTFPIGANATIDTNNLSFKINASATNNN